MKKDIELIYKLNKNFKAIKRAGGQTNRNYIVKKNGEKFFIRIPWEASGIVNRKAEAKNILALSGCKKLKKILPKYYLYIFNEKNILSPKKEKFDLPNGTMMIEHIEGRDIDGKDLEKPKIQEALIKTLYIFHTSKVKFVNSYDVFRDEILKYKNLALGKNTCFLAPLKNKTKAKKYPTQKLINQKEVKRIEEIEKTAKRNLSLGGKISTHNDLIFENLRLAKDNKVYLLDFEYAGFNIREGLYYDLGIILGGNLFQKNPMKIKTFEEILERAGGIYKTKLDKKKIYFGALINVLVMFWWGVVKYFSSTTKEERNYFKDYVSKREKGIEFLNKEIKKRDFI